MRSQRLCELRRFSECRSPPSAVPTGNKKTSCESSLDPPELVSHSIVAPLFGQSRWHLAAQPPTNPEFISVGKWGEKLWNGPWRHQGPLWSLCPLSTCAKGESASFEFGRERRVPGNHREGAPKTGLCLKGFRATDRTPIREFISTILLDANRQSG